MSCLIIEDDLVLATLLMEAADNLEQVMQVDWSLDWSTAESLLGHNLYQLIVLEQRFFPLYACYLLKRHFQPGQVLPAVLLINDGLLGRQRIQAPVEMIRDGLRKPFSLVDFQNKLQLLLTWQKIKLDPQASRLAPADFLLDKASYTINAGGQSVMLKRKEFEILDLLVKHRGQIISRQVLANSLWCDEAISWSNAIPAHISNLRSKLNKLSLKQRLQTIRGSGYRWQA